jgi:hypothetical protein
MKVALKIPDGNKEGTDTKGWKQVALGVSGRTMVLP